MANSISFRVIVGTDGAFGSGLVDETSFDVKRSSTLASGTLNLTVSAPGIGLDRVDGQREAD